jgi:hypothetical protein
MGRLAHRVKEPFMVAVHKKLANIANLKQKRP